MRRMGTPVDGSRAGRGAPLPPGSRAMTSTSWPRIAMPAVSRRTTSRTPPASSSPIFGRPRWRSGLRDRLAAPRRHPSAERRVLQGHVRPRARLVWVTDRGAGEPGGEGASRGVGLVAGEGHPQLQEHDAGGSLRADGPLNDGVVNTARQLLDPAPSEQFGGLVIADHGDVLGHYDRRDALAAGHTNAGLFHSGAGFGDDELFTLYQRVTEVIETAIVSR